MSNNSSATAMLGLEGMAVMAVSERDGELEYAIETTATAGWCPVCGAQARLASSPFDLGSRSARRRPLSDPGGSNASGGVHAQGERQTWTDTDPTIAPRSSWTERAREQACRRVGRDGHALAVAASAFGADETAFTRASAVKPTVFAAGVVDLHRVKLIDIVAGRAEKCWPTGSLTNPRSGPPGLKWRRWTPCRGYGAALSAGLPNAVWVLDPFHVAQLGFACVDDVRRRVQQPPMAIGSRGDPLYGIRRVLRRGAENLTATAWGGCGPGSMPATSVARSPPWVAAQELRAIYRCRDRNQAAQRLHDWTVMCIDPGVPEIGRLARTITTWRDEFLAHIGSGRISNGPPEAVNRLIKKILRVGHGFRNFDNCPLRVLLHLWDHVTITPDTTTTPTTTLGRVEPDQLANGSIARGTQRAWIRKDTSAAGPR